MSDSEFPAALRPELDRCVKCGMCLAECPTYRLEPDENESPRGRLALIEGLVDGHLVEDPALFGHLDNCLGCRRCERVCPSLVPFGLLMDEARGLLSGRRASRWSRLIQNPSLLRRGTQIAQAIPSALSRPLGAIHQLHALARALGPTQSAPASGDYAPHKSPAHGRVGLFLGCASAAQQGGALHAALRLLQHTGYGVFIPATATCCGALAQHAGERQEAARLAATNRAGFDHDLVAVVSIASGCGNHIDSYQPGLAAGHQDICRFLLEHGNLGRTDFLPLPGRVFLHTPCSVENVYRGGHWASELLTMIPDLEVIAAGETGQCCGAAGDYMLRHRREAQRLRRPILEQIGSEGHETLLTSNVGCAMHLADGMRHRGGHVEVLHPVELLARQLQT
jgi:glycolate oxidase iron-sulfur subunit